MLISRLGALAKVTPKALRSARSVLVQTTRNSSDEVGFYRVSPKKTPYYYLGHYTYVFMWWWIMYHWLTEYEHIIFGEFEYPDVTKWTDEELGIPPDDED